MLVATPWHMLRAAAIRHRWDSGWRWDVWLTAGAFTLHDSANTPIFLLSLLFFVSVCEWKKAGLYFMLCAPVLACWHLSATPWPRCSPPHPHPQEPSRTLQNRLHLQKASFLFIIFSCLPYGHACYHNILMPSRKAAHDKVGISPSWIFLSPPLT